MPVVLDLGPVATAKPRSAKISASSSITWLTGWTDPARRLRRGQRHVERLGRQARVELGAFQRRLALGDRGGDRFAQAVDARPLDRRSSGDIAPSVLSKR